MNVFVLFALPMAEDLKSPVFEGAISLVLLCLALWVTGRRLFDVDLSAWWAILLCIPYVNVIPALFLLLKMGSEGENRCGPPPVKPKTDSQTYGNHIYTPDKPA